VSLIDRIKSAAKATDYAIGLPTKGEFVPFPEISKPTNTGFVVHHHEADVAGCFSSESPVLLADGTFTPISAISAGDMVQTRFGHRKVNNVWYNGDADTWIKVDAPQGTFHATPNHKFWVKGVGWVAIGDLYASLLNMWSVFHPEEVLEASDLLENLRRQGKLENSAGEGHARDQKQLTGTEEGLGDPDKGEISSSLRRGLDTGSLCRARAVIGRDRGPHRVLTESSDNRFEAFPHPDPSGPYDQIKKQDFRVQQLELERWRLQRTSDRGSAASYLNGLENPAQEDRSRTTVLREVRCYSSSGASSHQTVVDRSRAVFQSNESPLAVQEVSRRGGQDFPRFSCGDIQIQRVSRPGEGRYDLEIEGVHEYVVGGFVVHNSHYDLRIQIPNTTVGSSWAIPKAKLPGPGEKVLAVRQGDHRTSYFDFEGHIPEGYGKGQVSIAHKGPVEIIESRPDMVRFGLYQTRTPQEYLLRQTKGKSWLLMNTTPQRDKINIPEGKYPYREIKPEKHRVDDADATHEAKIDGAHTFMVLDKGQRPRIFSYRRPKSGDTGLIEHSQKLVHWTQKSPADAGKTVLRGETWGKQKGKNAPLRPEIIGGLLNANVWKSRQNQEQVGKLQFSPFDVDVYKGKDVSTLPIERRKEIVKSIARQMKLELPASAKTPKAKQKLWETIRAGKHPQTREGVIQWRDYPTKIKLRTDYDGKITGFFPAEEGSKYHGNAVGGFYLSHDGTTSRVGTGLSDRLRKEMHSHPDRFVGLTATVSAQEKLRSGKLRAPSFMRFHIDKNVPEQLDKIQSTQKIAGLLDFVRKNKALTAMLAGGAIAPLASLGLRSKQPLSTEDIHNIRRIFQKKYNLGKDFTLDVAEGHQPSFDPRSNTVRVPPDITATELAHELGHAADYAAGDKSLISRLNRTAIEQSYLWSDLGSVAGGAAGAMIGPGKLGPSRLAAGARGYGIASVIPRTGRLLEELRAHTRGLKTLHEQGIKPPARDYLSSLSSVASYALPVAISGLLAARGIKTGEHKDRLPGGLADKKKPADFDKKQLSKGVKVEREHVDNKAVAREIAMDHLVEDAKYYDKLEKIEKHSSLLDRIKFAAARWSEEMAKGTIGPENTERLRQAKGLGIRQIGKTPMGEKSTEKNVFRAFGGDDLGPLVSKRLKFEIMPDVQRKYLELARAHPELMNPPVAEHKGGGGWIERALTPVTDEGIDPVVRSRANEAFHRQVSSSGAKYLGLGEYAPGYNRNPVIELPGGHRLYDVHHQNIGMTPKGEYRIFDAIPAMAGERHIPHAEALAKSPSKPEAAGLLTRIREGKTGPRQAPTSPRVKAPKPVYKAKPKGPPIRRNLPGLGMV